MYTARRLTINARKSRVPGGILWGRNLVAPLDEGSGRHLVWSGVDKVLTGLMLTQARQLLLTPAAVRTDNRRSDDCPAY